MSLIESVSKNDLSEVKRLLAIGTDINAVDEYGRTALSWAANGGYVECVVALLDANADVDKFNETGYTPLLIASSKGHTECVRLLIERKANIHMLNKYGYSPMHLACRNGHLACVQILIAAGADRDRPNNNGFTPLFYAILWDPNIAQFLLHSGAKVKNVSLKVKIPDWMNEMVAKRHTAMYSTLVVKALLKRRLGLSKDVTHLIALCFWNARLK